MIMCGGINLYPSTEAHKQVWQFSLQVYQKYDVFFFFVTQKVAECGAGTFVHALLYSITTCMFH